MCVSFAAKRRLIKNLKACSNHGQHLPNLTHGELLLCVSQPAFVRAIPSKQLVDTLHQLGMSCYAALSIALLSNARMEVDPAFILWDLVDQGSADLLRL